MRTTRQYFPSLYVETTLLEPRDGIAVHKFFWDEPLTDYAIADKQDRDGTG